MPNVCTRIITGAFYCLAFFTPLLLTKYNSELFEFNKMLFVYIVTVIVTVAWMLKSIREEKFSIRNTPFDIPLILFFLSQVISTIYSIDPHISIWGYYGRFNGGLLSIICYLVLYGAAVTHLTKQNIQTFILAALSSGFLVALYGVAQHFGVDDHLWVQDVKNRVFSTLGQPNWLAAYMAILIPITVSVGIIHNKWLSIFYPKNSSSLNRSVLWYKFTFPPAYTTHQFINSRIINFIVWISPSLFYTTLLFTKSKSGFIGFWLANAVYAFVDRK